MRISEKWKLIVGGTIIFMVGLACLASIGKAESDSGLAGRFLVVNGHHDRITVVDGKAHTDKADTLFRIDTVTGVTWSFLWVSAKEDVSGVAPGGHWNQIIENPKDEVEEIMKEIQSKKEIGEKSERGKVGSQSRSK